MSRARKLVLAAVGVVLIAGAAVVAYQYDVQKQQKADAAAAMLSLGIAEFNEERYSTALETLSGIQRGTEHDWRVAYYTGVTQIRLKDFEAAATALEEARLLNAYDEDIPFALGVTYFKLGNLALAKSYFHSVLEINPDHAEARGLMGSMASLERMQPGASTEETGPTEPPVAGEDPGN